MSVLYYDSATMMVDRQLQLQPGQGQLILYGMLQLAFWICVCVYAFSCWYVRFGLFSSNSAMPGWNGRMLLWLVVAAVLSV